MQYESIKDSKRTFDASKLFLPGFVFTYFIKTSLCLCKFKTLDKKGNYVYEKHTSTAGRVILADVLPKNPIMKIKLWKEANKIINELNSDKTKILNLSISIQKWWNDHKSIIRKKIKEKINV